MKRPSRFAEDLRFRVPRGVRASLARLAADMGIGVPDLLRQIVQRELEDSPGYQESHTVEWERPHGQRLPEGSTRRILPNHLALGIRCGLDQAGLSLREAAEIIGIDNSYLCRLTLGTRFPSHAVAARLVIHLPIDAEIADALLDLTREHEGV